MIVMVKALIPKGLFEDGDTSGAYATTVNTIGIGDPVPAGNDSLGSGDKFDNQFKMAIKKRSPEVKKGKRRAKVKGK